MGSRAVAFKGADSDGTVVTQADLAGKVSLLYFWATWCAPCVTSSPAAQRLHENFSKNGAEIIGVHYNSSGNPVEYAAQHGYTFTIIPHGSHVSASWGVKKVPTILLLDRSGAVIYSKSGFAPDDEDTIAQLIKQSL